GDAGDGDAGDGDAGDGDAGDGDAGDGDAGDGDAGDGDAGDGDAGDGDAGDGDAAECGDGEVSGDEVCDTALHACCNDRCNGPAPDGLRCRAQAGDCDVAEECDGSAFECPPDAVAESGIECRRADGVCDVEERCDGVDKSCPADGVADHNTRCRGADEPCDAEEFCNGTAKSCPADEIAEAGVVCRPAVDECDGAEQCDGLSDQCPLDGIAACTNIVVPAGLPRTLETDTSEHCSEWFLPSCDDEGALGQSASETNYLFTAPSPGTYAFDTIGSTFDTSLYIFAGAACSAELLGCNDNRSVSESSSLVVVELDSGVTVPLTLDGQDGASGDARLRIQRVTAPGDCSNPQAATLDADTLAFTHLGTDEVTTTCGSGVSGISSPDAVFEFTADRAGTYQFDTYGSSFDTSMAVIDGDLCGGFELDCNDDVDSSTTESAVRVELEADQTVLIAVEAFGLDPLVGLVELRVTML
ncbi:MAG: hypothetical protein OXT09_37740, partial [Myxococcales bacterium]|nr:hypothetical protein [Myxococcales bacterium]